MNKMKHGEIEKAYRSAPDTVAVVYWWESDPHPVEGHPVRRYTSYYQAGNATAAEHLAALLQHEQLRESNAAMERVLAHIGNALKVSPGDVPSLLAAVDRAARALPKGGSDGSTPAS